MSMQYEKRMLRVLQYIHDNPAGDLSLDRLAEEAAMSRFHWHRVFRGMTGETCAQAVRRVRLHKAANLLLEGEIDPAKMAAHVGYDNPRSFGRAFAAHYGLSPSEFRKQGRHTVPLLSRKEGEFAVYPIEIRKEPARKIMGLKHIGPYHEIGQKFEAFSTICRSRDLWPQFGQMVGVYFDSPDETPAGELRSLAGAEWRGATAPAEMEQVDLPAGRYAVLTYKGPYAGLGLAYDALFGQWLPSSGELPADAPCFEVSQNCPLNTTQQELVTEICLALEG